MYKYKERFGVWPSDPWGDLPELQRWLFAFDYGKEGRLFHDELDATFREVISAPPEWRKVLPEEMHEMLAGARKEKRTASFPIKTN